MIAKLIFDLSDQDDAMEYARCVKSRDMSLALFEIAHNLKKKCNNICDGLEADSDKYDGVYVVFQQIAEVFDDHGIRIDELIR